MVRSRKRADAGWLAKFGEGGRDALAATPVPGRPPKLSGAQIVRLYELIVGVDPALRRVRAVDP
jgi:transposase